MDNTQNAVAIFDKLANLYQTKYMDVRLYHEALDYYCATARSSGEILELACGPGNITRYLLNKRPDLKILATDLSPVMIKLAQTNNPEAQFMLMDCRNIPNNETYDGIICGFAMPYLTREEALQLIETAANSLKPRGLLYVSTIEGAYANSQFQETSTGEDQIFMHYHEAEYLLRAIQENHLNVVHMSRVNTLESDGKTTTDLLIIASK